VKNHAKVLLFHDIRKFFRRKFFSAWRTVYLFIFSY